MRPGWYVLGVVTLYALIVTVLLARGGSSAKPAAGALEAPSTDGSARGLWFPIPGARLPVSDDNLPGAPRTYRHGISQGFDFFPDDAGVPIAVGTPVIAAADATVVRADGTYTEMDPRAWVVLMDDVAEAGADEEQLDRLRGRQVWLRTADGTELRYGHLAGVSSGVRAGVKVYRGQVIGYVGNSGTDRAVEGRTDGARLRFEVWLKDGRFFGSGMDATEVRLAAAELFVGP